MIFYTQYNFKCFQFYFYIKLYLNFDSELVYISVYYMETPKYKVFRKKRKKVEVDDAEVDDAEVDDAEVDDVEVTPQIVNNEKNDEKNDEKINTDKIKPFLKWAGGKTQLLQHILPRIPKNIGSYYEPFIGAGSVLIAVLKKLEMKEITISGNICVSDINPYLIACYQVIKHPENFQVLSEKLQKYQIAYLKSSIPPKKPKGCRRPRNAPVATDLETAISLNQEEVYYYLRTQFIKLQYQYLKYRTEHQNENTINQVSIIYNTLEQIEVAALMIFLNKTSFRGLYRENKSGINNVPYGNYYTLNLNVDLLHNLHTLFNKYKVEFILADFTWCQDQSQINDFVYLDPPYYPEDDNAFTNYQADGFNLEKNKSLVNCCNILHQKNVCFLLSNSQTPFIKEHYQTYIQPGDIMVAKRSINSKNPGKLTGEYLISNY